MHDRRSAKREAGIRQAHPHTAGIRLFLSDDPVSTKVWAKGAEGERRLGHGLEALAAENLVVLHDRRIPGSTANIDHLVVGPNGIYVIDAKRYSGRVELRSSGTMFRPGPNKLYVGGRDKSKLVDGMTKQILAVNTAAKDLLDATTMVITAVLCFVDTEWGLFAKPFSLDGVKILWPKVLYDLVRTPGPLTPSAVQTLAHRLAERFPAA